MKRITALFLCLMLCFSLSGCWQDTPEPEDLYSPIDGLEAEETPDTLLPQNFSLAYVPGQSMDPIDCPDGVQYVISSLLFEGLFQLDETFTPQALLCRDWTYDAETMTYTLVLRRDVNFSDGSPLTAADVAATLKRAKASPRYQSRLKNVTSITTERDDAVVLTLSAPNVSFLSLLDIPIVKAGSEKDIPIGTGPYLLDFSEEVPRLVASQNWWQNQPLPVDHIQLVETADENSLLYRFTSHDIQLVTSDLTGTSPISATDDIVFLDAPTTQFHYLGFNMTTPALSSLPLRRALALGVQRSALVSAFLSDHATAAQFPVPPQSPLYPAALETRYSLTDFHAALADCTDLPERPLVLLVNEENAFKVSVANHLAQAFTDGGIAVEVSALPWTDYLTALQTGNFDLYYAEVKLTADWDLSSLLSSGGSLNYGGWSNAHTDTLLSRYAASDYPTDAMNDLCVHLQQAVPIVPLCFKSTSVLMQSGIIEGLQPTMAEPFYHLSDCTFHLQTP